MARHKALEDENEENVPNLPKEPGKVIHSEYILSLMLIYHRL